VDGMAAGAEGATAGAGRVAAGAEGSTAGVGEVTTGAGEVIVGADRITLGHVVWRRCGGRTLASVVDVTA